MRITVLRRAVGHDARGWVKTCTAPRDSEASVRFAASARRTARAVGAETASRIGQPAMTAFCTISTDRREVRAMAP
ncbi:hypothetical protein ruthe_02032 [Rubellimicrobium thermophilum DSM 16684]|uniref:Uncharacterized protein n=1 Tax=Rubellimicrobium thermophilum DSM 16684 TaxID=1123069 RepID=S9QYL2_9RHOB|nr:hypothetical protein ruthe_02032 [Rubellimicrobium thermophilum DSM 16684]